MKIRVELVDDLREDELIIRCREENDTIKAIRDYAVEQAAKKVEITFYKDNREFFFSPDEVLFFETRGEEVCAHTADEVYTVKYRLYELEQMLSRKFVRVSKSAILNVEHVYSVTRNLTASSLVNFNTGNKGVYVSRHYYHRLRERLSERSKL
ncbi:MAG: LytTR family DNA-binding domain-containing protein [Acutalibacteraceae bacterium]